jgi:NADH:ubiquinone oxidoreductase subunit 4 (subunit M)
MLISILLGLPLIGIIYLWLFNKVGKTREENGKITKEMYKIILGLVILNFIHTLFIMHIYDATQSGFQFPLYIYNRLIAGIDGITLW